VPIERTLTFFKVTTERDWVDKELLSILREDALTAERAANMVIAGNRLGRRVLEAM